MIPAKIKSTSISVATINAETIMRIIVFVLKFSLSALSLLGTSPDFLSAVTTPL